MRRCFLVLLFVAAAATLPGKAILPATIEGHLESGLHSQDRWLVELQPASTSDQLAPDERRWHGTLNIPPKVFFRSGGTAPVLLAEAARQAPRLYADLNLDGVIAEDEQIPLLTSGGDRWVLRFAFDEAPAGHWPVLATMTSPRTAATRTLQLDDRPYVTGNFALRNVDIRVRMPFDLRAMEADPRLGYIGMDSNGDGVIDTDPLSPEFTYANNERVVFRVLDRYVSVQSADVASGTLLLTEHPASAYERFDLTIGATVPEFEFETIEGSSHRLSDFDGDYVLLFVWDVGCVFAAEEIATIRRAVEKFGGRGFSALGFSDDEDHTQATEFIREREMHWPQVVGQNARHLIRRHLRAVALPTVILLDPQRRVISRGYGGEPSIRGEGLLRTLEELLNGRP